MDKKTLIGIFIIFMFTLSVNAEKIEVEDTLYIGSNLRLPITKVPDSGYFEDGKVLKCVFDSQLAVSIGDAIDKYTWKDVETCLVIIENDDYRFVQVDENSFYYDLPNDLEEGLYKFKFTYVEGTDEASGTTVFTVLNKNDDSLILSIGRKIPPIEPITVFLDASLKIIENFLNISLQLGKFFVWITTLSAGVLLFILLSIEAVICGKAFIDGNRNPINIFINWITYNVNAIYKSGLLLLRFLDFFINTTVGILSAIRSALPFI